MLAIDDNLAIGLLGCIYFLSGLISFPLSGALNERLLRLSARGLLDGPPVTPYWNFAKQLAWAPYVLSRSRHNTPDKKALALARMIKGLYLIMLIAAGLSIWLFLGRPPIQIPPPDRAAEFNSKPAGWYPQP